MTLKWSNFNPSGAVEWLSKLESRTGVRIASLQITI